MNERTKSVLGHAMLGSLSLGCCICLGLLFHFAKPQAQAEPPAAIGAADVAPELIGAEWPEGSATTLPAGCEIWVKSKTKEWKLPAGVYRVELRSPDGPTSVGFMEGGAVEVRCFGIQTLRFGASSGVDDVIRLELAAPAK
jgi:hypothetical protein